MDRLTSSIVLVAYAEPLVVGRRVVVFGDALAEVAAQLLERGARTVCVYDTDAARAAEASARNRSRNITFAPLGDHDLAVREGAFDVGIVEDLSQSGEPEALLRLLRRVLAPRGTALVATPNPDVAPVILRPRATAPRSSIAYYDLYDFVSEVFAEVRMLGQTPFVGYAVVDFAPSDPPEVSVDTGFIAAGAEEPEWFVALAGERLRALDAYSIVQLPAGLALRPSEQVEHEGAVSERALETARARIADLELDVERLRAEARDAKLDAQDVAERLERERQLEARISELESRAADAEARANDALERAHREQEHAAGLAHQAASVERLGAENAQLRTELERSRSELRELTAVKDGDGSADYGALEAALRERGDRIRDLERDLNEAERIGRALVVELDALRRAESPPLQPDRGEELAADNARLSADLAAARWTVEELEDRLNSRDLTGSERESPAPGPR